MARAACIVHRKSKVLMVRHHHKDLEWWCLPGGGVEPGEAPSASALRELKEECCVDGVLVREICVATCYPEDTAYTFLVDIGDQEPQLGADPEFPGLNRVLVDVWWMSLAEIPERDRAFLWAAGLLAIPEFYAEVSRWGDSLSYPDSESL